MMRSLADLGVVSPGPDTSAVWAATFMGGVHAQTVYFADEPEMRAIEELLVRFGASAAAIVPPESPALAPDVPSELVDAVLANDAVRNLQLTAEDVVAVIDALGGVTPSNTTTES